MIWIYRLVAVPLALFTLPILAIFNRKLRAGLKQRFKPLPKMDFTERPIWIHTSSGEFEYAKSLIREFKREKPKQPVVVTYFSPTYVKAIESFPGVDLSFPLPLDLPGPIHSLLKKLNPRALLIARTDFWPELLSQTHRRQIPVHVFSYTQRHNSSFLSNWIRRWLLSLCHHIHCVSDQDLQNLKKLKLQTPVSVTGDTRYDQVQFRLQNPKALPQQLRPNKITLVSGSTWPEDEAILIPALTLALKTQAMQWILVPHEPTAKHVASLEQQLRDAGLTFTLFSNEQGWSDKNVLIVDRVGVLAELYLWGAMAFVGGSFKGSVHSVMEALGAGTRTIVGPYFENNREALEFKNLNAEGWPLVTPVNSAQELQQAVEDTLNDPQRLERFQLLLKKEFNSRLGASQKLGQRLNH